MLRRIPQRYSGWLAAVLGICFIGAFLCWAAAGKTFPLANQFQGTLNFATPLILGALAGVMCERAGVINIAIEGQFLVGAFTAAVVSSTTHNNAVALIAAAVTGVLLASLLAVFSIKYLVNQVVLGVVLVVFASGITGYLFDQFLQDDAAKLNTPTVLSAVKIPLLGDIPFFGPILFNQTVLVYLTYIAVAVVTFVLFQTRWGLRVRAVGEHPKAADTVGIKVKRVRYSAVLAAGILAGLGGSFFTVGYAGSFNKEMTAGNGFIALAALIMGRWHPIGAMVAALFFGFATQLQSQLQIIQTPIPGELLLMAPYLATIIAVAGLVGRVRAPKADGEPYVTEWTGRHSRHPACGQRGARPGTRRLAFDRCAFPCFPRFPARRAGKRGGVVDGDAAAVAVRRWSGPTRRTPGSRWGLRRWWTTGGLLPGATWRTRRTG